MKFKMVPLAKIYFDMDSNYRKELDKKSIKDLSKSFISVREKTNSRWMLNPVDVVELEEPIDGKRYRLSIGYRRFLAAQLTAKKHDWAKQVPAWVRSKSTSGKAELVLAMVENIQREAVSPLDEARAIERLMTEGNVTQKEVSGELGRSTAWVSQRLSLLKLPADVQGLLQSGNIEFSHARQITRLEDEKEQEEFVNSIWEDDLTSVETQEVADSVCDGSNVRDAVDRVLQKREDADDAKSPTETPEDNSSADDSKSKNIDTSGLDVRVREVADLAQQMIDLKDGIEELKRFKAGTNRKSLKDRYEKERLFNAGAQMGIAWALNKVDEVDAEAFLEGEVDLDDI